MAENSITQSRLKELLHYCPETGVFTCLITRGNNAKSGDICKSDKGNGYLVATIYGKRYYLHRLAFLYMKGMWPENNVDHINHNRSDNRWANLRDVTHKENCMNTTKRSDNTSGVNGVHFYKRYKKWSVNIHLGYFDTLEEAVKARKRAELEHGYHSNHGLPVEA